MPKPLSFSQRVKTELVVWALVVLVLWCTYYYLWGRYLYIVTAYCNCPICINVAAYNDGKFASGKNVYWGGIAADADVKFGSKVELVPLRPNDWSAVGKVLKGRRKFIVEDRGGKIRGKHIDLYIPDSMGGHKAALKWGVRKMRIKISGRFAE